MQTQRCMLLKKQEMAPMASSNGNTKKVVVVRCRRKRFRTAAHILKGVAAGGAGGDPQRHNRASGSSSRNVQLKRIFRTAVHTPLGHEAGVARSVINGFVKIVVVVKFSRRLLKSIVVVVRCGWRRFYAAVSVISVVIKSRGAVVCNRRVWSYGYISIWNGGWRGAESSVVLASEKRKGLCTRE